MGEVQRQIEVVALLVSPVHRCDGRPRDGLRDVPAGAPPERRDEVRVEAGRGIVGDRYAGRAAHARAAVTVMDADALDAVADELGVPRFDPALARRNVVLRGVDVATLRGREVVIDGGDGAVLLAGWRPANPCAWMDVLLAPGAHRALRGRGGVVLAAAARQDGERGRRLAEVPGAEHPASPGLPPRC